MGGIIIAKHRYRFSIGLVQSCWFFGSKREEEKERNSEARNLGRRRNWDEGRSTNRLWFVSFGEMGSGGFDPHY